MLMAGSWLVSRLRGMGGGWSDRNGKKDAEKPVWREPGGLFFFNLCNEAFSGVRTGSQRHTQRLGDFYDGVKTGL